MRYCVILLIVNKQGGEFNRNEIWNINLPMIVTVMWTSIINDQNEWFQYQVEEAEAKAMFFAWIFGVQ